MPFVRKRGEQLAIVHGVRHRGTQNVEQNLLFTLYSRREALAALGRPDPSTGQRFQSLLESAHPDLRFDWKKLRRELTANLDVLPEKHDYDPAQLDARFMGSLAAFAKQLVLADPQGLAVTSKLIDRHRAELEYLKELIGWRLETPPRGDDAYNQDNEFLWRFAARSTHVPSEVEEHAAHHYEKLEHDRASGAFKVLTAAFDGYAEGYNYLGLVALDRQRLDEAIAWFRKTMEVGRAQLPKKIARQRWWTDHSTRPYLRGLMNLALALNQAGRYEEALGACELLAEGCHQEYEATAQRAVVWLNLRRWPEALEAARSIHRTSPAHGAIAAFAAYELDEEDEARPLFLHAVLHQPRTVAMLVDAFVPGRPADSTEGQDHNGGVMLRRSLAGYLGKRRPGTRRFFAGLWKDERVVKYREELARVTKQWREDRKGGSRAAYERMQELQTWELAQQVMSPTGAKTGATAVKLPAGSKRGLRLLH